MLKRILRGFFLIPLLCTTAVFCADTDSGFLEIRVWRVEFPGDEGADIDWGAAFSALDDAQGGPAADLPREMPGTGTPLLSGNMPVTRYVAESRSVPRQPPAPVQPLSSGGPSLSTYQVGHRDPAEVDHLLKRMTGQIEDVPTGGTQSGAYPVREWRDPVRTTLDPGTGQIVALSGPASGGAPPVVSAQPAPLPPLPANLSLRTPLTPRISHVGRIRFDALRAAFEEQGKVVEVSSSSIPLRQGIPISSSIPYVHSRGEGETYTVCANLRLAPGRLGSGAWSLRLQPEFMSFELAPRTVRLKTEAAATFRPGETVVLSGILATECARKPSMFDKHPPSSRTVVFLTRPGAQPVPGGVAPEGGNPAGVSARDLGDGLRPESAGGG